MNSTALQLTLRKMRAHLTHRRSLGAMLVVALVLGFAGPFGTYEELSVLPRLAYWLATVFLTYGLGYSLSIYIDLRWAGSWPFWLRLPAMAIPAGFAATVIVTLINVIATGPHPLSPLTIGILLAECLLVALAVVTMVLLFDPSMAHPGTSAVSGGPPPILERLPLPKRGQLLALSVEDHYVDIITDRGKSLVLMRLADAMRETGDVAGLQIHRSHWVARDGVVRAHRAEGKLMLELRNGLRLPVSRGFLPEVRAAGLAG